MMRDRDPDSAGDVIVNADWRSGSRRREVGLILAVLLLGLALRLWRLDDRGLWYDEAFSIFFSEQGLSAMIAGTITQVEGAAADVHPLLYYLSLDGWMSAAGTSLLAVRFLSVLAGMLTVALTYAVGRELWNRRVALGAMGLVAVSPFHIHYSTEARMYAQLGLLSLLMVYFFLRGRSSMRWWPWLGFGVGMAISLYTHNLAFLAPLALGIFVLLRRRWDLLPRLVAAYVLAAVLFAPWLMLSASQWRKIQQAYWVPQPGISEILRTIMAFTFDLPVPDALLPAVLFSSLLVLALTLYRSIRLLRKEYDQGIALSLTILLAPPILLFVASQIRPVYIDRGLMVSSLAYLLLLSGAWLRTRWPRWAGVLLLPLVSVWGMCVVHQNLYREFPRSPFDVAADHIQRQWESGDIVVHDNKLSLFPSHYYRPHFYQTFIADPAGAGSDTLALPTQDSLGLHALSLEEATAGADRVWFIIFSRALEEASQDHANLGFMEANFIRGEERAFNDLLVIQYVPR
jgi:4-amino-4-deoxy-L-arabinose transferase-like glycosyltransferase